MMNERIKELAEQAGGGPSKWYTNPDVLELFAELIIKECVDIVNKRKDAAIDAEWLVDEAMSNAVWDIEEHFGVD
jgi:hypothetical protein